ncbi:HNH endonuclease [Marinobacter sp. C7]|uniref:HNH endonuclease n=1 Tax=Marinobacter sp. C7 TaxID=2951363 RepID=UPI00333D9540
MWISSIKEFASFYGISEKQARYFQCTGEHLIPHSEGGDASVENIVAVCSFCNHQRHHRKGVPDPITFRKLVRKRLSEGRWNRHLFASRCQAPVPHWYAGIEPDATRSQATR